MSTGEHQNRDEDDDFFECQESQECFDPGDKVQETLQVVEGSDQLTDGRVQTEPDIGPLLEEAQINRSEGDETFDDRMHDCCAEMQKDAEQTVEFDDKYLMEMERDLTDMEKESRQQQSLALKEEGNCHFKAGDWFEAEQSYTKALGLCPVCFSKERAVMFSNRAAARLHLDMRDMAISDCTRAIELNPNYVRALLRRAELYEQMNKLDEALEDYKAILDQDPSQTSAQQGCMRLPQQIHERNQKMKEEMMDKLKDLGNMILRPFGLSTNNFQVNQDAATGTYSVNFIQNPANNR